MYPWLRKHLSTTYRFILGSRSSPYYFKTDVGLGTDTLIYKVAEWLLCSQKLRHQPCLECKSCLLMQSNNHPDFHILEPIEDKDIGIDQVRELIYKLQNFAQQGKYGRLYSRS